MALSKMNIPKGSDLTTWHNRKKSIKEPGLNSICKYFTIRAGQVWDKLPDNVVMAEGVRVPFKRLLDQQLSQTDSKTELNWTELYVI